MPCRSRWTGCRSCCVPGRPSSADSANPPVPQMKVPVRSPHPLSTPPAGSAAHVRDRVIFQQPHRFPKHRAAHLVAFQQRCLGPEDRPDLPAAGGDIVANGGRQHLGQLAAGRAQDQLLGPARLTWSSPPPSHKPASTPSRSICSTASRAAKTYGASGMPSRSTMSRKLSSAAANLRLRPSSIRWGGRGWITPPTMYARPPSRSFGSTSDWRERPAIRCWICSC
ncbi:Uncharacterised protein [Mycobacterium tuberculosis]|nr:Uncharacterised protein [Mycobacterium tuberculosis]